MRHFSPFVRVFGVLVLAAAVFGNAGCKWFRKDHALYASAAETRPLEVPPDLDLPRTEASVNLPDAASISANRSAPGSSTQAATVAGQNNGFLAAGTRAQVFERVDQALGLAQGLTIINRAQLLGSFELDYGGERFLIRVTEADNGSFVSAVDQRGQPINTPAAQRLVIALKAAVAQ